MHSLSSAALLAAASVLTAVTLSSPWMSAQGAITRSAPNQTIVLHQLGFPTIDSEELSEAVLTQAITAPTFVTTAELTAGDWISNARLLVLPYGSAFPAESWPAILRYLKHGGNLLLIGGQPLRVPVAASNTPASPQDSFARVLDLRHSYTLPEDRTPTHFHWRHGYTFLPRLEVNAQKIFVQEGRLEGLGYLDASDGTHAASPIIVLDHSAGTLYPGSRIVALPFKPAVGYFASPDGQRLLKTAARYAQFGTTSLQVESQYSTLRPGELPELTAHLRTLHAVAGTLHAELLEHERVLEQTTIPISQPDTLLPFRKPLRAGVYTVRATYIPVGSTIPQQFAENGFQVEDLADLESGESVGVNGDYLSLGKRPFFPVGVNYFSTEANGWDFSGPRNAALWESDFADMQRHGVNFVRTGVWMGPAKFVEPITGNANERFLRNLEAFLAAAHRHQIAVNFTFFAFTPRVQEPRRPDAPDAVTTTLNPYLDTAALEAEKGYVASIAARFAQVPWLCYDLINEPSFSNPRLIFHGNVPNNDPVEQAAWRNWLEERYGTLGILADAWRTTPTQLKDWASIPLPKQADLAYDRYGNDQQVRAFDYNLFAQDMFANWVRIMADTLHQTGSHQLINVGQDEGGVTNRLLNQFYATAGVSFTTNHTYWQDNALLWDSVVAKRPGMPNITGETGYQPAWNPDGVWRYDELTGTALEERKWALGFAAGSSGAMQWDWDREVDFGMQRSDGSAKSWETLMHDLSQFAARSAPYATAQTLPEIALVLPQSLQLSTRNPEAVEAQQAAVRTLFYFNRVEAYAVGEYQIETLGKPKLIILPSAVGLSAKAWTAIEDHVRAGATLLISGPFSADEHLHALPRAQSIGLETNQIPLQLRDESITLPSGNVPLEYTGLTTTILDRASLADQKTFTELPLGRGKILVSALPLEWNTNLASISRVYDYAINQAGIARTYTTTVTNPGILICPTRLPHATLYVFTSETETTRIAFTDTRSGKQFTATLDAGRAALLLVGERGELLASYHWPTGPKLQ